jgi:hypothetical protein
VGAPASGDAVATRRSRAGSWVAKLLGRQALGPPSSWAAKRGMNLAPGQGTIRSLLPNPRLPDGEPAHLFLIPC